MFYSLALGFQLCNAGKRGVTFVLVYFRFVLAALCLLGISRLVRRFFLRFRFGDRKEILRDRLEEFERPFSIDVISGHYILRDR